LSGTPKIVHDDINDVNYVFQLNSNNGIIILSPHRGAEWEVGAFVENLLVKRHRHYRYILIKEDTAIYAIRFKTSILQTRLCIGLDTMHNYSSTRVIL